MLPWKLFFRFFSALVLMATGGFAAGHDLPLPFATAPAEVAAPLPDTSTTTTTAPVADPAPLAVDDTTTTTTAPAPVVAVPVSDPAPVVPPTVPGPTKPAKPLKPTTTAPDPANAPTPPAVPVDGAAPSVCAAAATSVCGPATPAPSADTAARVKACQDWWNSLADAFDHNGRSEWATQARAIAGRCEAMITQWQQMEQRWEDHHNKGDHNGDGHPDNGWKQGHDGQDDQEGDNQSPPPPPPAQPQAKQVSRHGEGRH